MLLSPEEGKGLAYFVPDISRYDKKNVVIVGGGDSAVDWALNLFPGPNP